MSTGVINVPHGTLHELNLALQAITEAAELARLNGVPDIAVTLDKAAANIRLAQHPSAQHFARIGRNNKCVVCNYTLTHCRCEWASL